MMIVIVVGVGILLLTGLGFSVLQERRRVQRLQERFGSEYARTIRSYPDREAAEIELKERLRRHDELDLKDLSGDARRGYLDRFVSLQGAFEADPRGALAGADSLVHEILQKRGYPIESTEQLTADLSVDHPEAAAEYRAGCSSTPLRRSRQMRTAFARYERITYDLLNRATSRATSRSSSEQT